VPSVPPSDDHKTLAWWTVLRGIAVLNIVGWAATWGLVDAEQPSVRAHLGLSAIYVAACAFRSFWPRIDLERTVLVDSPLSSIVAGRTAATFAEVSFAIQVGLLVHQLGGAADIPALQNNLPWLIVALLSLAQVFCWIGVVSLSHLGHAIEESIWGLTFAVVTVALIWAAPALEGTLRWLTFAAIPGCIAYVAFMGVVDVPMYVGRWRQGKQQGEVLMGLVEGFSDALRRREATRSWAVWRPEVAWLTGYFSFAVWASLGMVHIATL